MQILINIDESTYHRVLKGEYCPNEITDILLKSKILPEHGDLIDRKDLIENGIHKGFCDWYDEIKMADTIIEADMEE